MRLREIYCNKALTCHLGNKNGEKLISVDEAVLRKMLPDLLLQGLPGFRHGTMKKMR